MTNIATRLLEKNPGLVQALEAASPTGQYKAVEPYLTQALLAKIGKAEGKFIQRKALVWAIIDIYNGDETGEELDY